MPTDTTASTDDDLRHLRGELGRTRGQLRQREEALVALNRRLLVLERNQAGIDTTTRAATAELEAKVAELTAECAELRARLESPDLHPFGPSQEAIQLRAELDRVYGTKLFRYTRPARRLYGMLRRL